MDDELKTFTSNFFPQNPDGSSSTFLGDFFKMAEFEVFCFFLGGGGKKWQKLSGIIRPALLYCQPVVNSCKYCKIPTTL